MSFLNKTRRLLFKISFFIILNLSALQITNAQNNQNINQLKLNQLILDFNKASDSKNLDKLVEYIPPHLLASMSLRLGETTESLKKNFKLQLEKQLKQDSLSKIALSSEGVVYGISTDAQPYAIIPTTVNNSKNIINTQTLAVFENNSWYLIYGGMKAVKNQLFSLIYPSLGKIKFPNEKVTKNQIK